ncbi:MAG: adenylosuccinate lyase [Anaerolineae bacterium]|nr:adenylosuccinate lyase [Anaerolineae bacterium]
MSETFDHETYLSPFAWRYGSPEMRRVWSEAHKRRLWRRVWLALAEAQMAAGLVSAEQLADLRAHADDVDIPRAHAIEAETRHDLMAELLTYAEQSPVGGGVLHLGATSMDIEDNADVLRLREGLDILLVKLRALLTALAGQIERWADTPCLGYTHLQPAEPTTVGHRLASYGQDFLADWQDLRHLRGEIRGKGFRGAVGTGASYAELLAGTDLTAETMEQRAVAALGLKPFPIVNQTYPRRQDLTILHGLTALAQTAHRFAADLRILQSPALGEWAEPFGKRQVGSSAMPFKRNPITAEKIDSLARFVASLPGVAWSNGALSFLERTLDDSANRRVVLPEAFLAADELLKETRRLVEGLHVDMAALARNLRTYGVFSATERVLMAAARAGGNRQSLHEVIRRHSMGAWEAVRRGEANPLADLLASDAEIGVFVPAERVRILLDASQYVGDAPARARAFANRIRSVLAEETA